MRRRQGFTLVELLVSMALIIFIMSILSEAFVTGIKTFRDLKALGDLNERLRTATTLLRDDLSADHFEGRKKLSDPNFWLHGPPQNGYLRLYQGSALDTNAANGATAPYWQEGVDLDGVESVRAWDHAIQMTVKKRGNELKDFMGATVPGASPLLALGTPDSHYQDGTTPVYKSQWAEVTWFLRRNGAFAGNSPLFGLYRRQLVVTPDNSAINWPNPLKADPRDYLEVSRTDTGMANPPNTTTLYFNNPTDLTVPQRRFGMTPNAYGGQFATNPADPYREPPYPIFDNNLQKPPNDDYTSADLIVTDVLSFSVRVLLNGSNQYVPLTHATVQAFKNNNPAFYPNTANGRPLPAVFDTWSSLQDDTFDYSKWSEAGVPASIPLWRTAPNAQGNRTVLRIVALEITLRIWDVKTEQTRQVTFIQDM